MSAAASAADGSAEPVAADTDTAAAAAADADADADDAVPTLVAPIARESVEIAVKYEGFIKRQQREVARMQRSQGLQLPEDLNYGSIASLSCEEVEKLSRVRPRTLQEAAQISGVTPGCLSMLLFHLRKHGGRKQSKGVVPKSSVTNSG